jgi:hypothetical protein
VKNHRVLWCKPYSYDNLGSWISDNHFSFARLRPLFFQDITAGGLAPIPKEVHVDLTTPVSSWVVEDLKPWLKSSGIKTRPRAPR